MGIILPNTIVQRTTVVRPKFLTSRDVLDTLQAKQGKPKAAFSLTERVC